jgi:hypothetical protein
LTLRRKASRPTNADTRKLRRSKLMAFLFSASFGDAVQSDPALRRA